LFVVYWDFLYVKKTVTRLWNNQLLIACIKKMTSI
jgi:hypothetical protein